MTLEQKPKVIEATLNCHWGFSTETQADLTESSIQSSVYSAPTWEMTVLSGSLCCNGHKDSRYTTDCFLTLFTKFSISTERERFLALKVFQQPCHGLEADLLLRKWSTGRSDVTASLGITSVLGGESGASGLWFNNAGWDRSRFTPSALPRFFQPLLSQRGWSSKLHAWWMLLISLVLKKHGNLSQRLEQIFTASTVM